MLIGFISSDTYERCRDYFEHFAYANKDQIKRRAASWVQFQDGTVVEMIYSLKLIERGKLYDQIIFAGPRPMLTYYRSTIKHLPLSDKIPEEYRIMEICEY